VLNPAGGPADDRSDEFVLILRHAPALAP